MSIVAAISAACACSAWARPISPPSTVTALLSDMFCGLNGATRTPCRCSTRHSPATSVLLPASELAPWTISVRMPLACCVARAVADDPLQLPQAVGQRRRTGLQDVAGFDLRQSPVTNRRHRLPTGSFMHPGRIEFLAAPGNDHDVRRPAHDFHRVGDDPSGGERLRG